MKVKYLLIISICAAGLLGSAALVQAQDFQQQAGELSTLYRGRTPAVYPYRYNGTVYWNTRYFSKGDLLYNGKFYRDVWLNPDAFTGDLVTRPSEQSAAIVLDRDQVAWFTLEGRRFVNLQYLGYPDAPEGFFEVLKDGQEPLLMQRRKTLRNDAHRQNELPLDWDNNYSPEVITFFVPKDTYYTLTGGKVKKLGGGAARRKMREASHPEESIFPDEHTLVWHPTREAQEGMVPARTVNKVGMGLPDGYFSEQKEDTATVNYAQNALTATYRNKIYEIGTEAKGSTARVSGTVYEAESGLPLPGVVIFDGNTSTYVRSNAKGQYNITLPVGENKLNFNADNKTDLELSVVVHGPGELDVVMSEKVILLKGAIVSAESMAQHRNTAMGVESVSMRTIGKIPSAFGEGDIIKAVLTLPGVKTVGEASGGFNVRGGSADQNLILYNDNTIYNPSHLFGMFSSFNPDLVDEVQLYKSSIPAEYGGRISSVLQVSTKEGSTDRVHGSVGIGLLTSRAHVEGPIGKKTTFVAGGRITYSDYLMKLLPKNSAYAGGSAMFGDANLSVTHHFDSENSIQAFGYFASDKFGFSGDTTFRYTNINGSVAYKHKGADGKNWKISAGYDHYANTIGAHAWETGAYDMQTFIRQAFVKAGGSIPLGRHTLGAGVDLVGYGLDPGIMAPFGPNSQVKATRLNREWGFEPALYVSDNWAITDIFSVDAGIRLSSFLALNPSKFYIGPEFRISTKVSPVENFSIKAGFNTMRQYIHLISNTAAVSPMDTWRLSSAAIAPTTGWQAAAGVYWTLLGSGIDLSLEGYYKQSRNALDYKSGAMLSMNPQLADALVPVFGRAYGVEVMMKRPVGKVTGWLSYSYSRSQLREMQDRGAETINGGAWYNAPYDKPHEIKLALNWAMTHRFSLSVNLDYSTGRPTTIPIGRYRYNGAWHLAYSERNSYRIPDYFRMDAALNIDPGHYKRAWVHASFTIGVYNITGRKNPYSVFFKTDHSGNLNGYMLSVFASQIPYININLLF